jgi:hypothetical protein
MPRPQLLCRGQRAGKKGSPKAGTIRLREHQKPGKMAVFPSAWNQLNAGESQALCLLELRGRAGVPSRKAEGMKAGAGLPFPAAPHPACG